MTLFVRPFAQHDLEPSFDLWVRAWNRAIPERDHLTILPTWQTFMTTEALPRHVILSAALDERLAGFAVIDTTARFLHQIVVDPDLARRGIGRALMGALADVAPEGFEFRVLQKNAAAVAFYERLACLRLGETISPSTGWPSWRYAWRPGP